MIIKNQSLFEVLKYTFDNVKTKKYTILIISILLYATSSNVLFFVVINYLLNIVLVYVYLAQDDRQITLKNTLKVIKENFYSVFKVLLLNILILGAFLFLIFTPLIQTTIMSKYNDIHGIIFLLFVTIYTLIVMHFSIIYTIIDNLKPFQAILKAFFTIKKCLFLLMQLYGLFILLIFCIGIFVPFVLGIFIPLVSLGLWFSTISITMHISKYDINYIAT